MAAGGVLTLALLSVVAGRPYEDTKGRFRIELAEKWELMPQFGDMSGMTFRRVLKTRRGDAPALLLIHMDSVQASDPKEYADAVEANFKKQAGYERLDEKPAMVGGKPALFREYKMLANKKPKIEKRVRTYYLDSGGHLYLLHFESTSAEFRHIEKDVDQMISSFVPLGGNVEHKKSDIELDLAPARIAGRWINADELVMVLAEDGSFALAEAAGRYEVKGDTLTMIIPGQGRESFTFVHDAAQGTLTLSSPNLGEPMVYHRIEKSKASDKPKDKSPAPEGGLDPKALEGRWRTSTPNGPLDLDLKVDKRFTMGTMQGDWAVRGDRLILSGGAKAIEYKVRLDASRLLLSGGDLEEEVAFSRAREP